MAGKKRGEGEGKERPRRRKGEGSVFWRSDRARWVAEVVLSDGKTVTRYCRTEDEAVRKMRQMLHDNDLGLPAPASERGRLGPFLADWLERTEIHVRPTTHKRYRELLTGHVIPQLGRVSLAKLTPAQLEKLYAAKMKAGLAPATVRQLHVIVHHALGDALRKGLVARNVADMASPPRVPRHEIAPYSPEEVARLLQEIEGNRLEALYVLAIATGARLGELLALRWQDVELDGPRPAMRVRGTLVRLPKVAPYVAEPKTDRSRRTVPLPTWAMIALREHRRRQLAERLQAGTGWQDLGLVFCTESGDYLDGTRVLRHDFYPLLKRANLRRVRLHDLRHTAATLALRGGTDLKRIADMLGHSTIGVTANTYAHTTYDTLADATSAIEQQVKRAQK